MAEISCVRAIDEISAIFHYVKNYISSICKEILTNFILYDMIITNINNTYATFCKSQLCYI